MVVRDPVRGRLCANGGENAGPDAVDEDESGILAIRCHSPRMGGCEIFSAILVHAAVYRGLDFFSCKLECVSFYGAGGGIRNCGAEGG